MFKTFVSLLSGQAS